ncbi:MAG: pilus assembly protein TadG-related protein [Acidimicrobiales bacterium]
MGGAMVRCSKDLGGDGGQVVPLMALVVIVAVVAMLLVARVGATAAERARARNAADAAALAGVTGSETDARGVAEANGAQLERFVRVDGVVEVDVRVGGSRASARAVRAR